VVQPLVTRAISFNLNRVRVYFSDPMNALGTAGNFTIPSLTVTLATASSDRLFTDLTTTGMVVNTSYTVTVTSPPVVDDIAQALSVNTASFLGAVGPADVLLDTGEDAGPVVDTEAFDGDATPFNLFDVVKISAGEALYALQQSMQNRYVMRAYNTVLTQAVFWVVLGAPDFTGAQSPYPPVDLSDIVLEEVLCPGQ
jgi:hypothetical protein